MIQDSLSEEIFPKLNLSLLQDKSAFCFGIDAVLLADFALVKKDFQVYDLGTGSAIIPLILAKKSQASHITALEIQKGAADLAKENVKRNNLENKISVIQGDIKRVKDLFERESADCVISNPPYAKKNEVRKNLNEAKNIARHEILCELEDVVFAAACLLKSGRSFFMIHRPERLSEICCLFSKYKLEAKTLEMVHSYPDSPPSMILIEGRKNARPGLKVLPPLVLYKSPGQYSDKVLQIYEGL